PPWRVDSTCGNYCSARSPTTDSSARPSSTSHTAFAKSAFWRLGTTTSAPRSGISATGRRRSSSRDLSKRRKRPPSRRARVAEGSAALMRDGQECLPEAPKGPIVGTAACRPVLHIELIRKYHDATLLVHCRRHD